jgi:nucleoside-diphosphate-sugar epimerase
MDYRLPGLILTGASGFEGRHFIEAACQNFRLFCVARRSAAEVGVQANNNLQWIQADIADWARLKEIIPLTKEFGGVDYIVHLAGYYDYTNMDHPNYARTNVEGTKNILELARHLTIKRFLFASSLASCPFNTIVSEESSPDANIPYARSKKAGEEMVGEYSRWFPCAIIRIAAVFSDWCEYLPLYYLLNNWLSGKLLNSRIIAGQGQTAIPYIHVDELARFLLKVIEKSEELEQNIILNASPDGAISHLELFRIATQYHYPKLLKPIFAHPRLLVPMILVHRLLSRMQGKETFERLWMLDYIDKQLVAECTKTRNTLGWELTPNRTITHRLSLLIENKQKKQELWRTRNESMLRRG